MPCYHPIEVNVKRKSLYAIRKINDHQIVPCGRCIGCRAEQGRQWAVRMIHEARMHESSVFVTLTYDQKRLPKNAELRPKDLSGFIKGLRQAQDRRITFFGCGEYGEISQRPHYHSVLFGVDFLDRDIGFDSSRPDVWRSQALDRAWGLGIAEGGSVTMASASYVAGYVRKKIRARDYARANPVTGEILRPEFARMSLRPALGRRWIKKHWNDVYPRDYVVIEGFKAKPPRYYDKYMDLEDEKGGDPQRREIMENVRQKRLDEARELTRYQIDAAEKTHQSRINLFSGRAAV